MCIVHFKFPFFSHFFTLTLPRTIGSAHPVAEIKQQNYGTD